MTIYVLHINWRQIKLLCYNHNRIYNLEGKTRINDITKSFVL
jgi:hypothetical protein